MSSKALKLKPCPFCGAPAAMTRAQTILAQCAKIVCTNENCEIGVTVWVAGINWEVAKQLALKRWNHRV